MYLTYHHLCVLQNIHYSLVLLCLNTLHVKSRLTKKYDLFQEREKDKSYIRLHTTYTVYTVETSVCVTVLFIVHVCLILFAALCCIMNPKMCFAFSPMPIQTF